MSRHLLIGIAVVFATAGCSGPKPLISPEESEEPGAPRTGREPEVQLPPVPKEQGLLPFDVYPRQALEYFVDPASISLPGEGIVRFTVVARSGAAANVSYEGFRCVTREYKVYARANRDGAWIPAKEAGWDVISDRTTPMFRRELYWNFFCPGKHAISSTREGVDALRLGRHPNARPDGTIQ